MLNSVLNIEKQGTDHIGRAMVTGFVEVTDAGGACKEIDTGSSATQSDGPILMCESCAGSEFSELDSYHLGIVSMKL
jgi:hypothetical protein